MDTTELTDEQLDIIKTVEKDWKTDVAQTQTQQNLIAVFPEAQELLPDILEGYWEQAATAIKKVKELRRIVDKKKADPFTKWFYTHVHQYDDLKRLEEIHQQIRRLERLKVVYEKNRVEKQLSKEFFKTKEEKKLFNIDRMFATDGLLVDIVAYDGIQLRNAASRAQGLCPFHTEKTPSFFVYQNNWFHCYGCSKHGNFIDYIMEKHHVSFREALEIANRFI